MKQANNEQRRTMVKQRELYKINQQKKKEIARNKRAKEIKDKQQIQLGTVDVALSIF